MRQNTGWALGVLLLLGAEPAAANVPSSASESFRFDSTVQRVQLWGVPVPQFPRVFFQEMLPALFERTLEFESGDLAGGTLEWIFTGDRGGFTIQIQSGRLRLTQRYYDSFGFWKPQEANAGRRMRHPEHTVADTSAACALPLSAIRVQLDHKLNVAVAVNGSELIRQPCLLDVSRHQLAYTIAGENAGTVRGRLAPRAEDHPTVLIDTSKRRQTMMGFGGITSPTAFAQLSAEGKRRWWRLLAEYNLRLHREYPMGARLNSDFSNWDRLEDALPTYYGDNFPNGQVSDFDYIREIRRLGGAVLFEFWDLPLRARRERADDKGELQRDVADPATYTQAIVRYCEISKARTGAAPEIVGVQNEKNQPTEVWHEMTLKLRQELDRAGFRGTRIHMQDAITLETGIQNALKFRESDAAWRAIDYSATHVYDYQAHLYDPDGFDRLFRAWADAAGGKPLISTEMCVNRDPYQVAAYRLAFSMGQLYHKNLTLADAVALIYCFLLVNTEQPSYGWTRTLFVADQARGSVPIASSHQLRVFGAFSRRIRGGMVRLEAGTADPDLLPTAFQDKGGQRTLVLLNRGLRAKRVTVDWKGMPFRFVESADPYRENSIGGAPAPAVGGKTEVEVPPGAIVTLSNVPLGTR